jgi:hypothetical protein
LLAMNDNAVFLKYRAAIIAGKPRSHTAQALD